MIGILAADAAEYLRLLADLEPVAFTEPEDLIRDAPGVEILLASPVLAVAAIERLLRLRWLQSTWAGVDALTATGLRRDYVLTRVHTGFGPQMVEYVLAYLLAFERRLFERIEAQQAGRWDPFPSGTLQGKTLGVLGTGDIGVEIAEAARRFGMGTVGCNRTGREHAAFDTVYPTSELLDLVAQVDHLVAALPATPETVRLVDREVVAAMRPRAMLINIGRGSTVDLDVVVAAVASGHLGGAVIDVTDPEPLPGEHPAWSTPGVYLTAHTAALSRPRDIAAAFRRNLDRYRGNLNLEGRVDFDRGY